MQHHMAPQRLTWRDMRTRNVALRVRFATSRQSDGADPCVEVTLRSTAPHKFGGALRRSPGTDLHTPRIFLVRLVGTQML
jgi:hypothetical protein